MKERLSAFVGLGLLLAGCGGEVTGADGEPGTPAPRARVVVVRDAAATEKFLPQAATVAEMVSRGIMQLTRQTNVTAAWRSLVSTQDVVGIKVLSRPGPISGTRPEVVAAVVKGLTAAGVPASQIVVWDLHLEDLRAAGYCELAERHGIRVAGSVESGWDESVFLERPLLGALVYGDLEFGRQGPRVGRRSHGSKLVVSGMTRIISIAPLLNHNLVGVFGHLIGLGLGSVDNTHRFEASPGELPLVVGDIIEAVGITDRLVLGITDALLAQYQGDKRPLLHYSAVVNEVWFSKDVVALDVLALQELENQRQAAGIAQTPVDLSLYENATVMDLGVSDRRRIDVERLDETQSPSGAPRMDPTPHRQRAR